MFIRDEWPFYTRYAQFQIYKIGRLWGYDVRKAGEYEQMMRDRDAAAESYEPIKYNPFELEPLKGLIIDIVKQWKQNAGKILEEIREIRSKQRTTPQEGWLFDSWIEEKQKSHQQLMHKIQRYEMYLNDVDVSKDWEAAKERAKQYPIKELYVGQLRKSAGRLMGKCPFHQDDSPSFVIYANNTFHCFGCSANGDAIDFVRKRDNLDFKQAVKLIGG